MMSALMLSDIAKATGGRLSGEARVENVSTDSRKIAAGDLFVALSGDNFDGNNFVAEVAGAGAAAALVSRSSEANIPQLLVDDTRLALGLVARINRRQFQGPLIALTGSAGKTTSKEMIAAILGECGAVLATAGNLNNEIGVPLTLLRLEPRHQYAVVEMGASHADDIRYLTQFAEPTIALVTNAMPVHIEGFGNLQTIADTKGQVFESVADGGAAIINLDDTFAAQWRGQAGEAEITTFSKQNPAADFYAREILLREDGATTFVLCTPVGEVAIKLSLLGEHNVANAVAASAAASVAGAGLDSIRAGLEKLRPTKGRMQYHRLNNRQLLIDDSYNANPGAVRAAIDLLANFPGTRCLVLGTMGELGDEARAQHVDVAAYAKQHGIERLLLVGEFATAAAQVFGEAYADMQSLMNAVGSGIDADVILVKGSRSAAMERVVDALLENNNMRGER